MECMKCGRETSGGEIFCQDCLAQMEKYPVSINAPVVIHKREDVQRKASHKKTLKPEEQITRLSRTVLHLRRLVLVFAALFVLTAGILVYVLSSHSDDPEMGSNYSTVIDPTEKGDRQWTSAH